MLRERRKVQSNTLLPGIACRFTRRHAAMQAITERSPDRCFARHSPGQEKDQYLGGWIGAAFFLVGAPAAILMGYMSHGYNRCNMFFWVVLLGAPLRMHSPTETRSPALKRIGVLLLRDLPALCAGAAAIGHTTAAFLRLAWTAAVHESCACLHRPANAHRVMPRCAMTGHPLK